jgi:hypothetical protein
MILWVGVIISPWKTYMNDRMHTLWPTPILVKTFAEHPSVNAELAKLFYKHRETFGDLSKNVYSSQDDLLQRF